MHVKFKIRDYFMASQANALFSLLFVYDIFLGIVGYCFSFIFFVSIIMGIGDSVRERRWRNQVLLINSPGRFTSLTVNEQILPVNPQTLLHNYNNFNFVCTRLNNSPIYNFIITKIIIHSNKSHNKYLVYIESLFRTNSKRKYQEHIIEIHICIALPLTNSFVSSLPLINS